jgi:hypothetical protein
MGIHPIYSQESNKNATKYLSPNQWILPFPKTNVATAKFPISPGTFLQLPKGKMIKLEEELLFGHKIAP